LSGIFRLTEEEIAVDKELQSKLQKVRLIAMDFDGIHTDGCVYTDQDGRETVRCSRIDGLGLEMIRKKTKIALCVVSKEVNPVVSSRCKKLQIASYQAIENSEGKLEILKRIMAEQGISPEEVVYMGDDLNDIAVLRYVGVPITVPNGHPLVKNVCVYITTASGGNGAIRELCEAILAANGVELKF